MVNTQCPIFSFTKRKKCNRLHDWRKQHGLMPSIKAPVNSFLGSSYSFKNEIKEDLMKGPQTILKVFFLFVILETIGCATAEECFKICGNRHGCSDWAYPKLVMGVMPAGELLFINLFINDTIGQQRHGY